HDEGHEQENPEDAKHAARAPVRYRLVHARHPARLKRAMPSAVDTIALFRDRTELRQFPTTHKSA
ncbi:MAG TPA: hypothetical protein VFD21_06230, partial [Vicinamibacterales bacterium]|nr:hypothetical protein [Vicinamibacterales bacterium]